MLVQQAIDKSYREAAIKRIGDIPTVDEYSEGLDRLNGFLDSLFGAEIGCQLTDVQIPVFQRTANNPSAAFNQPYPLSASNFDQPVGMLESRTTDQYILANNTRVLNRITAATTVFFPQYPNDGARVEIVNTGATAILTLDGNGRRINGANTATFAASATSITYFYRADLGNWIPLAALSLTDELPLPSAFDRLIICGTAISLTALDEVSPTTGTMFMYERLLKRCKERYFQREAVTPGGQNIPESTQAHDFGMPW